MTTTLRSERHSRVLLLTLESPCGRNPVSPELGQAIADAVSGAAEDASIGVILITGSAKAFSVGGDIAALVAGFDTPRSDDETRDLLGQSASGCTALTDSPKPTIAMVNGAAAGGGLALAAACDIRIAAGSAKFAYAYPRIGLAGDLAANWSLTQILGPARALYFALSARTITADEALALGLVSEVHPDEQAADAAMALAADIASMSPMALAQVKANLSAARSWPRHAAIGIESENFLQARRHPDHREAAMAFLEKRQPRWADASD